VLLKAGCDLAELKGRACIRHLFACYTILADWAERGQGGKSQNL
jgi:hypothetical protein